MEGRAPSRVKLEVVQGSDPGRDPNKQVNEDSSGYAECRFGHLLVLCDGMGGHYGGREASRTAIATIFEVIDRMPPETLPSIALKTSVEEAGRRVYALGGPPENRMRPGSTVVSILIHDKGVDVAHVGDSRAYVIRSNQIYPLTRDHSMVQGMIDAGMLTEEQAIGHPDLNKITRALGMRAEVEVEIRPEPMEVFPGDLYMTTSDGLTDVALGRDILGSTRQSLGQGSLDHACQMLIKMANDRGGPDNVTVQIARVVEIAAKHTIPDGPFRPAPSAAPSQQAYAPAQATPVPGQAHVHPGSRTVAIGQGPPQAGTPAPAGVSPYGLPPSSMRGGAQGAAAGYAPGYGGPGQAVPGHGGLLPPTVDAPQPGSVRVPPTVPGPTVADATPRPMEPYRANQQLQLPPQRASRPPPAPAHATAPYGPSAGATDPARTPQRNSAVFIIFGLASAVAVLLLVVLWLLLKS